MTIEKIKKDQVPFHATSWGRAHRVVSFPHVMRWHTDELPYPETTMLPYGLGRSYGDSCLNGKGTLLMTGEMNHLLRFDETTGLLRAEAGVSFSDILGMAVPRGWFLPVTPGTRFVTLGGAIANDVHGKNHHQAGTLGCHIPRFEVMRSDGRRLVCSRDENAGLFHATIGGLGLTGLITWAEIQMRKIEGPLIDQEVIRFDHVDHFLALTSESDKAFEYTVAWVDCLATGPHLGRGLFIRGNHSKDPLHRPIRAPKAKTFPIEAPSWLLNPHSVKLFNTLYYRKQFRRKACSVVHYEPFFYPLDAVSHWNRMYGKQGFFQHQCVVPFANSSEPIREIFREIAKSRQASFLAVLKVFGENASPGLLSFPMAGVTLALDFPNRGPETLQLMDRLDRITMEAKGRIYPAKDGRMSAAVFQAGFPGWETFAQHIDPSFSSDFWRRVSAQKASAHS